jgi:hypothetical protein
LSSNVTIFSLTFSDAADGHLEARVQDSLLPRRDNLRYLPEYPHCFRERATAATRRHRNESTHVMKALAAIDETVDVSINRARRA